MWNTLTKDVPLQHCSRSAIEQEAVCSPLQDQHKDGEYDTANKENRHRPFDFRQKKIPSPSGGASANRPTNAMMMIAVGVTVKLSNIFSNSFLSPQYTIHQVEGKRGFTSIVDKDMNNIKIRYGLHINLKF